MKATARNQHSHFPVENLWDDNTNTFYHSDDSPGQSTLQPWVQLELATESTVAKVEITNRRDCCGDRLKNIEVWVGNHAVTKQSQEGISQQLSASTLCGKFDGQTTYHPGHVEVIECTQPIPGRYITMLRNEPENGQDNIVMNIAEFKAFTTVIRK